LNQKPDTQYTHSALKILLLHKLTPPQTSSIKQPSNTTEVRTWPDQLLTRTLGI
jgi:hypothetical protein